MTTPNPLKPQYFFIKGTIMKSYISRKWQILYKGATSIIYKEFKRKLGNFTRKRELVEATKSCFGGKSFDFGFRTVLVKHQ
jgi:hypothetical protein